MRLSLTVLLLLSLGCSAKMVSSAKPNPSPNAPTNESERIGLVRYKSGGMLAGKRRADAYKKMRESCGGPYRITSEGEGTRGAATFVQMQGSSAVATTLPVSYWYISYQCER